MLPLLLFTTTAVASFTWTVRLPATPFQRGLHHIHSPEFFLPTYGLSGPCFELLETTPPIVGKYHLIELGYKSLWGRAHARMFTDCANHSHFLLFGEHGEADTMGSLCAEPDAHGGLVLRGGVWPLTPDERPSWQQFLMHTPRVCPRTIEAAIYDGCVAQLENPHLLHYRRLVLAPTTFIDSAASTAPRAAQ